MTTKALDKIIHDYIIGCGAKPSFLNYGGFPASACISINNEVIHGIPAVSYTHLASNVKKAIAQILVDEGYVKSFQLIEDGKQGVIRITLKYSDSKSPVITGLRRVSKPGLRIYSSCEDMPKVRNCLLYTSCELSCKSASGHTVHTDTYRSSRRRQKAMETEGNRSCKTGFNPCSSVDTRRCCFRS